MCHFGVIRASSHTHTQCYLHVANCDNFTRKINSSSGHFIRAVRCNSYSHYFQLLSVHLFALHDGNAKHALFPFLFSLQFKYSRLMVSNVFLVVFIWLNE